MMKHVAAGEAVPREKAIPFRKILIANRGEIVCRIIRTLDELGIASVAIHHRVETGARHVRMAGEAIEIFGDTPVAAHLDGKQIIEAALSAGADAIHPGYGFLSENAGFARAVAAAGLTFIGPDAETIALMGDKISARNFAEAHGVPVAPSVMPSDDLDAFAAACGKDRISAAHQGGGRRRRQGHEHRALGSRIERGRTHRRQRSQALFRRRPRLCRALCRAAAPHRGAGAGRRRGQRHPSVRARMLGAAPLPEDHRGGAGRQPACGLARPDLRGGGFGSLQPRTTRMPARSSSSSAPTAASSSSK